MKCVCDSGLPQMYLGKCRNYIKKVDDVMILQSVAKDGTKNSIDLSTIPVPEATFLDLFRNSDPTKRAHLFKGVKNFTQEAGEAIQVTWDDNSTTKIADGQLTMTFTIPETSPLFIGLIQALECNNPGMYLITNSGQIVGYANPDEIATDKKLYPIPVEEWNVTPSPVNTSTTVAMVVVTVKFSTTMDYTHWIVMESGEHNLDLSTNYEARPAVLSNGTTPATVSSIEVVATIPSNGVLGNSVPLSGLALADFVIYNKTQATSITALTVTESTAGVYSITFAAQTSADVVQTSLTSSTNYVSSTLETIIP